MTNKEKVIMLKQYRILQLEYSLRNNQYLQLRDKLMFPSADAQKLSDMPTSHAVSNTTEQNYIKLESLEAEMSKRVSDILDTLQRLERAIAAVDDSMYRTILAYRYIEGMKWEKICCEISYEWKHTHRLHSRAIKEIQI